MPDGFSIHDVLLKMQSSMYEMIEKQVITFTPALYHAIEKASLIN
jgi:hypothetical protein